MAVHPLRNLGLKAISVALAALLWLTVTRDQQAERSLRVPLEFHNVPPGLEIVGDPPGSVDVRVRGASGALGRLDSGEVVAVLDLKEARSGQRLFHLLTDQVRAPFGIEVSQVSPPTVSLAFERSGRKVVPISPSLDGEPAPGYATGRITVEPATVEVIGPESRLQRVTEATTEPVSIENAQREVRDVVTVGIVDSTLRLSEARTASVTVQIVPAPIERTVNGVAVRVRNAPPGTSVRLSPTTVAAVVRGGREILAGLRPENVEVYVDLANLERGRYLLPVKGETGKSHGVVRSEPSTVEVRIR